MSKIIGNPLSNNSNLKEIIKKTIIEDKFLKKKIEFRDEIVSKIKSDINNLCQQRN